MLSVWLNLVRYALVLILENTYPLVFVVAKLIRIHRVNSFASLDYPHFCIILIMTGSDLTAILVFVLLVLSTMYMKGEFTHLILNIRIN